MNIAYITADVGVPVYGTKGASIHVNSVASEFSQLGNNVLVLTPSPGNIPDGEQKFQVGEIPLPDSWSQISESLKEEELCEENRLRKDIRNLIYNAWFQGQAKIFLNDFLPDFIYERYSLFGTAGIHLAQHYNIPHILEVNAPLVEEQQQQRGLNLPKVARSTQTMIFNEADHIIVVSEWLKDYVRDHGVNCNRITVQPNGVDPKKFSPRQYSHNRDKLGWKDRFVVGYVGTMKDWHGLSSVLTAVRLLKDTKKNLKLLLVGEGPQLSLLKQQIQEWKLTDYVHLTGLVSHQEVPDWVDVMDVAIVPFSEKASEYFSPVKLFEYMAMERPVIAAKIRQTTKLIDPGRTGWLYKAGDSKELANKLSWMEENKSTVLQTGKNACEMVNKHYTWKQNAERVIEISREHKDKKVDENSPLSMKYNTIPLNN